jgi:putative ABC transport system ATP-binding protein/ATP-binding cassette subfamily B protein
MASGSWCAWCGVLADPAVLVLDEALGGGRAHRAAYPTRPASTVPRAYRNHVAHRLATIRDADRIAVVKHGRVVSKGRIDLIGRSGHFAALYEAYLRSAGEVATEAAH